MARVSPGAEFISAPISFSTAAVDHDDVRLVLDITATEHRHQDVTSIPGPGMQAARRVSTLDLP